MIPVPHRLALKLIAGIGCALLLALLVQDRNHWKAKTAHYAELLAGERTAFAATHANYRAAAEQARREDAANAAHVRAAQAAINERTKDEFESRIAAARAVAGGLRRRPEGGIADPRTRRSPAVSGLSAAPQRVDESARQDGLPDADALIATEQAIQLDELINWVRRQGAVDVNKGD